MFLALKTFSYALKTLSYMIHHLAIELTGTWESNNTLYSAHTMCQEICCVYYIDYMLLIMTLFPSPLYG